MALYNIYSGLGGCFGGATYQYTADFRNYDEAEREAYQCAIEDYQMYEGRPGLEDEESITESYCEENGIDPEDLTDKDYDNIYGEYIDAVEGWIEYSAILTEKDTETAIDDLDIR